MIIPYQLPDSLNPDYMRGYVDGYEMAKQEMIERVKAMESLSIATATASVDDKEILK